MIGFEGERSDMGSATANYLPSEIMITFSTSFEEKAEIDEAIQQIVQIGCLEERLELEERSMSLYKKIVRVFKKVLWGGNA